MRHLTLLATSISCLCVTTSISAHPHSATLGQVAPLQTISLEDEQFDDLAAFGKAIGNASYVVLGEKTHGEGNVFALKARLVRYLHEKKGFDVLALESGLYDGEKINALRQKGQPLRQAAPGNLFYMYAGSAEIAPLFDYLDRQANTPTPLRLATFDSQHSGRLSQENMLLDMADYLSQRQSDLARTQSWREFAQHGNRLLRFDRTPPSPYEQQRFFAVLDQVDQILADDDKGKDSRAGLWQRISASLRSQALAFWMPTPDPDINVPREQAMTDNLQWLIERRFPDKKVIIWTHDFHGQKKSIYPGAVGALQRLREKLKASDFYHVYFTGYQGHYLDYNSGKLAMLPPAHPQSIESLLHKAGVQRGFIDMKKAVHRQPSWQKLGVGDYEGHFSAHHPSLADYIDGVFYLHTIQPSTPITNTLPSN